MTPGLLNLVAFTDRTGRILIPARRRQAGSAALRWLLDYLLWWIILVLFYRTFPRCVTFAHYACVPRRCGPCLYTERSGLRSTTAFTCRFLVLLQPVGALLTLQQRLQPFIWLVPHRTTPWFLRLILPTPLLVLRYMQHYLAFGPAVTCYPTPSIFGFFVAAAVPLCSSSWWSTIPLFTARRSPPLYRPIAVYPIQLPPRGLLPPLRCQQHLHVAVLDVLVERLFTAPFT